MLHQHLCISMHSVHWGCVWGLLYSVLFVRHAKDLGASWRSVGWMSHLGRTNGCPSVCVCVRETDWEYHDDIKQYHSGLCAPTQGTLCTFFQGWSGGWGGGGVAGGSMGAMCILYHHKCCITVYLSIEMRYGKIWCGDHYMKTIGGHGGMFALLNGQSWAIMSPPLIVGKRIDYYSLREGSTAT